MTNEDRIEELASVLAVQQAEADARPFYEIMSGALVWTDEIVPGLSVEVMGCLRRIYRFRTGLLLGQPEENYRELWEMLQTKCPGWIGFSPLRCTPSEELTSLHKDLKTKSGF